LKEKDPADAGVIDDEAGTEFPEPTITVVDDMGVPVHRPLLKNP
jgi:hypothetical protein